MERLSNIKELYHGSWEIVRQPQFGLGRTDNDYGQGFYCTEDIELAREWACSEKSTAWCNQYQLNCSELNVLDLSIDTFSPLEWLALLINNRNIYLDNALARRGAEWLVSNHLIDISDYDIIIGYRADDSFFKIARAFINNSLPLEALDSSLRSGELGIQYTIKSLQAFNSLSFIKAEPVDHRKYHSKRLARSQAANDKVFNNGELLDGTFLADLMRR